MANAVVIVATGRPSLHTNNLVPHLLAVPAPSSLRVFWATQLERPARYARRGEFRLPACGGQSLGAKCRHASSQNTPLARLWAIFALPEHQKVVELSAFTPKSHKPTNKTPISSATKYERMKLLAKLTKQFLWR